MTWKSFELSRFVGNVLLLGLFAGLWAALLPQTAAMVLPSSEREGVQAALLGIGAGAILASSEHILTGLSRRSLKSALGGGLLGGLAAGVGISLVGTGFIQGSSSAGGLSPAAQSLIMGLVGAGAGFAAGLGGR
ncbi:MAG: hypothetical protein OEW12_04290, partial [Deltaproteobacteria bacterium]|nr:hypothetical protein [Deltaproteobacteria bacterium]